MINSSQTPATPTAAAAADSMLLGLGPPIVVYGETWIYIDGYCSQNGSKRGHTFLDGRVTLGLGLGIWMDGRGL